MTDSNAPMICAHLECNRVAAPGENLCEVCLKFKLPNEVYATGCDGCDNEAEDYL